MNPLTTETGKSTLAQTLSDSRYITLDDERAFAGLSALAEAAGKDFVRGILLYTGDQVIP